MQNLQQYVREHGVVKLKEEFGVEVREYPEYNLYVLNYSQIESPRFHPIVDECRGLTIDGSGNVVSRSFRRFYNYGEGQTKEFDFSNCTVWEKADGSLTRVSWYPQTQKWEISTRGTAFAEANHVFSLADGGTFREWIIKAMGFQSEEEFQSAMNSSGLSKDNTYVMEYIGPENRIVTRYKESQMVILTVVDNATGKEYPIDEFCRTLQSVGMTVRLPELFYVKTAEELLELCENLPDLKEGFVVCHNSTGDRLKVKSRQYCVAHKTKGNGTPTLNSIIELVLANEHHEFLSYFEEMHPLVDPVVEGLEKLLTEIDTEYAKYKDIADQKAFALTIKHLPYTGVLFAARKDNTTPRHAFHQMLQSRQMNLLESYLVSNNIV